MFKMDFAILQAVKVPFVRNGALRDGETCRILWILQADAVENEGCNK